MERLPKIIIMIVAMTAIFLWVSTAFNSCGDKDLLEDTTDIVSDSNEEIDYSDAVGDDIFGSSDDDDDDFLFDDQAEPEEYTEEEDDDEEVDFTTPTNYDDEDTYEESTPEVSKPRTYSSSGEWMVIAGNYLVESNARVMIRKLRNLGYSNSEIGVFERSQYHTVIASRHSSNSAAINAANQIKNRGVECYVKKKEY